MSIGIEQEIVVLSADVYSVDGASGTTVFYLLDTDFTPVVNDTNSMGAKPAKANLPVSYFEKVVSAPGRYKAVFGMKADSKGKMAMTILDLAYLSDLKLSEVKLSNAAAAAK